MKNELYWFLFHIEIPDQRAEFAADEGLGVTAITVMLGLWGLTVIRLALLARLQLWDWALGGFALLVAQSYALRVRRLSLDQTPALVGGVRQGVRALFSGLWLGALVGAWTHALTQDWHATGIMVAVMVVWETVSRKK